MLDILEKYSLAESLSYLAGKYPSKVVFSTSFGQEDQVITDAIFKNNIDIKVFSLDTGRLFQETYELIDRTRSKYKQNIEIYFPNTEKFQQILTQKGAYSFYESIDNRKECCFVRKIDPLK